MPHQHERRSHARQPHDASTLREIANQIDTSRDLIDAAFMAALDLPEHARDPLRALLDLVSDRLTLAAANIETHATARGGDAA